MSFGFRVSFGLRVVVGLERLVGMVRDIFFLCVEEEMKGVFGFDLCVVMGKRRREGF
jgi:hypothetical protein